MASLADVSADDAMMSDPDDASMPEDSDMTAAAEELAEVLGIDASKVDALKSALEAFVLSVK